VWRNRQSHPHPARTAKHPPRRYPYQKRRPPNPQANRQSLSRPQRPTQTPTPLRCPARLGKKRRTNTPVARKKLLCLCLSGSPLGKQGSQAKVSNEDGNDSNKGSARGIDNGFDDHTTCGKRRTPKQAEGGVSFSLILALADAGAQCPLARRAALCAGSPVFLKRAWARGMS
jgi:hypothetical protein